MIRLIVESEKPVGRQLHSERRPETLAAIAPEQQRVAGVTAHFVSLLPNLKQCPSINHTQIDALPCQWVHRVSGVPHHDESLRNRVGNAHECERELLGGARHMRHASCMLRSGVHCVD